MTLRLEPVNTKKQINIPGLLRRLCPGPRVQEEQPGGAEEDPAAPLLALKDILRQAAGVHVSVRQKKATNFQLKFENPHM